MTAAPDACRLDKWLWHARFVKTRALAQQMCANGRIRINGTPTGKAHHLVRPGDVLTFPLSARIRIVRVLAMATRRGPASLARFLYEDLAPAVEGGGSDAAEVEAAPARAAGSGRPTKQQRRALDRLRDSWRVE